MSSIAPLHAATVVDAKKKTLTWNDLPTELILHVVAGMDFDAATIRNLQLVDKRLSSILKTYERSLCGGYATGDLHLIIPRFPDLVSPECTISRNFGGVPGLSFSLLAEVQHRSIAVSYLVRRVFSLAPVCCCLCGWYRMFEAGLLLLYRLQERVTYDAKVCFICSLPLQPLVAIFVALTQSLRAAERGGIGIIHRDEVPAHPAARSDVQLVFEDLILQHGPNFVIDILNHDTKAAACIRYQYVHLEEAQLHASDGTPPRKSMISHLKRSFASQAGCHICEIMSKVVRMAKLKPLRELDDKGVIKLVCCGGGTETEQ